MRLRQFLGIIILTVFCSLLVGSQAAWGATDENFFEFNSGTITGYNGTYTMVDIPETIGGEPVTAIGDRAFFGKSNIISISIPSSVTTIGASAFQSCDGLTSIAIPSSVTSIGDYAFYGCYTLENINLPSSLTVIGSYIFSNSGVKDIIIPSSVSKINEHAFNNCISLTSITLPSSLNSIDECAFYGCTRLTSISIPSGVAWIGSSAFYSCSSLASVTLPSTLTKIQSYTFEQCKSLTNITIPSSVTSIGSGAFSGCTTLADLTLPSSITSIESYAFNNCSGLKKITLSSDLTSIGDNAFTGCSSLFSISLPSSLTLIGNGAFAGCISFSSISLPANITSIGNNVFDGCSGLTSVEILSKVTSIGHYAFNKCNQLTSITIPAGVTWIGSNVFSDCSSLTNVTLPSSLTSIGDEAFSNCSSLTVIALPSHLTSIGNRAFSGCRNLTSMTIPSSVNLMGSFVFADCSALTDVSIQCAITEIEYGTFNNCSSLTNLIIPPGVTTIGRQAFWGCTRLASITIPSSVTIIETDAFYNCSSLPNVTLPSGITSIGATAFYGCSNLSKIVLPPTLTRIENSTFESCSALTNITIPSSVSFIGERAFYQCNSLSSITIPSNVTTIEHSTFGWCTGLTNVSLPSSVTSIGPYAFSYCKGLLNLTLPSSITIIGEGAFSGCAKLTLTIPSGVGKIGSQAFSQCSDLVSIYFEGSAPTTTNDLFAYTSNYAIYYLKDKTGFNEYPYYNFKKYYYNLTVIYKGNGNTSGNVPVDSNFYDGNKTITILGDNGLIKAGYDFISWNTKTDGTGTTYNAGDTFPILDDMILYAQWEIATPPVLSNVTPTDLKTGTMISATSDKTGTLYLVPKGTYADQAALEAVTVNKVTKTVITNVAVTVDTTNLPEGAYQIYIVANNGLLSTNPVVISIDNTLPTVSAMTPVNNSKLVKVDDNLSITFTENVLAGNGNIIIKKLVDNSILETIDVNDNSKVTYANNVITINPQKTLDKETGYYILIEPTAIKDPAGNYYAGINNSTGWNFTTLGDFTINATGTITGYTGMGGLIPIPASVNGITITEIGDKAFKDNSSVTGITFPLSITTIGEAAFSNCSGLTSIIIPATITTIKQNAFRNCANLMKVYFEGNAPGTLGGDIFTSTASSFVIYYRKDKTGFDSSALSVYSKYYYNLSVTYNGNGNTGGTVPIDSTVYEGNKVVTVLGDNGLRKFGYDFIGWSTKADGSEITYNAGNTFIIIDDIVLYAKWMTSIPPVLSNVTPTTLKAGIAINVTSNKTGVIYLVPKGTYVDQAALDAVTVNKVTKSVTTDVATTIDTTNLPEGSYQVYAVGDSGLVSTTPVEITIDNTVPTVSAMTPVNNSKLVKVDDNLSITFTENVVVGNGNIIIKKVTDNTTWETIDINDVTKVTCVGNVVTINPKKDLEQQTEYYVVIDQTAFKDLAGNYYIGISDNSGWNFTTLGDYIINAAGTITGYTGTSQMLATIPDTINGIKVTRIGDNAFKNSLITGVAIPASVTTIGEAAFYNCTRLKEVTIPENVASIGNAAFSGCSDLANLTIKTGVNSIGDSAFFNCDSLSEITIPSSITSVGNQAFKNCQNLRSAIFQGDAPAALGSAIFDTTHDFTIYYLKGKTGFDALTLSSYPRYYYNLTIIYDGNEKNSGDVPVDSTRYYGNTQVIVQGDNGLRKTGYDFIGWNTKADGSGTSYKAGNTFVISDDIILYAQWKASISPILSNVSPTTLKTGTIINVTSDNSGMVYLVPKGIYADQAALDAVNANKVTQSVTANVAVTINTMNLPEGVYQLYAVSNDCLSNPTDITIDNTVPTVNAFTPVDNSKLVGIDDNLIITFAENVVPGNGNITINNMADNTTVETIDVNDATKVTYTGNVVTINPQKALGKEIGYYVLIDPTAFKDLAGNYYVGISNNTGWNFTTIGDFIINATGTLIGYTGTGGQITIPESVNGIAITEIGDNAFKDNGNLTGITFPLSITTIGVSAFDNCSGLTSVRIPATIAVIKENAFSNCSKLTKVYFEGDAPATLGNQIFKSDADGFAIYYRKDKTGFNAAELSGYSKYYYNLTVTYKGNGNTSGNGPVDNTLYEENHSVTVLGDNGLVRTGSNFGGWNTQADGSGTTYKAGDTFAITDDTTLYARWENVLPVLSISAPTVIKPGTIISATSSEAGRLYLVPKGTYVNQADLDAVSTKKTVNVTAAVSASIATDGLNDGIYQVYAVDNDGGLSAASKDISIDGLAPTVNFINPSSGASVNTSNGSMIIVEVLDNLSGIDKTSIQIKIDNREWVNPTAVTGKTIYYLLNSLSDGNHTCSIKVQDLAGNETSQTITFTWDHYRRGFGFGRFRF